MVDIRPMTRSRSLMRASSVRCWPFFLFFFFQAEDGIRDHCVTGVQTCALPIYPAASLAAAHSDLSRLLRSPPGPATESVGRAWPSRSTGLRAAGWPTVSAEARAAPAVPLYSTAAFSSAPPGSSPDAAARSSLAHAAAPVCNGESATAAGPAAGSRASNSRGPVLPQQLQPQFRLPPVILLLP